MLLVIMFDDRREGVCWGGWLTQSFQAVKDKVRWIQIRSSVVYHMDNVLEISQQCVWEKTMIDLCLQAVVEVFTFFFYLIKNDFFYDITFISFLNNV